MEFLHRLVLFLVLVSAGPLTATETDQAAFDFCFTRAQQGDADCHFHPCPCHEREATLQVFEPGGNAISLCACSNQREARITNRQLAIAACYAHEQAQHRPCFVSRSGCPRGFEAIASYGDTPGTRFIACRDQRHQRPPGAPSSQIDTHALSPEALLEHYYRLTTLMLDRKTGSPRALPKTTVERLRPFFPGYDLKQIRLIPTAALSSGCFSDCDKIFCAGDRPIARWSGNPPEISRQLLHQIIHSEDCEWQGGREFSVRRWLRQLPDEVFEKLQAEQAVSADKIHFAMFGERHAQHRADAICLRLSGCLRD